MISLMSTWLRLGLKLGLGFGVSDLLDEHRREALRAQLLVHAEELTSTVLISPGWDQGQG